MKMTANLVARVIALMAPRPTAMRVRVQRFEFD